MDQLGNAGHVAKQVAHLVHASATGSTGLEPVPTIIIVSLLALFAVVGMIVGGTGGRPRGAHRA